MYYDDQGRQFNLLSGLAFGAILGAGIGMLLPIRVRRGRAGRDQVRDALRRGAERLGR